MWLWFWSVGGVRRVLPGAGRIPRGHWRAGQGELGPDSNVSSQASPMVSPSSEPLSELGRSVPQMKRWGHNSPVQTSHSCICSQMGTTEEADWSLASGAGSQPLGELLRRQSLFIGIGTVTGLYPTASGWCSFRVQVLFVVSSSPSGIFLSGQRTLCGSDSQWDPAMSRPLSSPVS